jgi:hypothetical protein
MEGIVRLTLGAIFAAIFVWLVIRTVNRGFARDLQALLRWLASHNLTKWHAIVFTGLLALFMFVTFQATGGLNNYPPVSGVHGLEATLGAITGPLTGAISRGFQSCCLTASLTLMAYCGPVLLIGCLMQFIRLPQGKLAPVVRMVFWILGWLVWFTGGLLSLAHALF